MEKTDNDLVSSIYQAAVDPSGWSTVAMGLASSLGTHQSIIIRSNGSEILPQDVISYGIDESNYDQYVDILGEDPWLCGMLDLRSGSSCRSDQFISLREFKKTRFFQLLCKPSDVAYMGGAVIRNEIGRLFLIACQRSESTGPFQEHEIKRIRDLSAHLDRAAAIGRQIDALQNAVDSLRSVLDKSPFGVVIFDEYSSASWYNSVAAGVFSLNDGLSLRNSRLTSTCVAAQQDIHSSLSEAISTSRGIGNGSGGYISVRRPSQKRPYQLTISPISKATDWGRTAFAVLFLLDPDNPPNMPIKAFQKLFALTAAEARVSRALAQGLSIQEIAESFDVSTNTVRTQVKGIFRKCDVRSQGELLLLLSRAMVTSSR